MHYSHASMPGAARRYLEVFLKQTCGVAVERAGAHGRAFVYSTNLSANTTFKIPNTAPRSACGKPYPPPGPTVPVRNREASGLPLRTCVSPLAVLQSIGLHTDR